MPLLLQTLDTLPSLLHVLRFFCVRSAFCWSPFFLSFPDPCPFPLLACVSCCSAFYRQSSFLWPSFPQNGQGFLGSPEFASLPS